MRKQIEITRFPKLDYVSTEGMNTLVTNISYCGSDVRKIMITSRYASEGKSYVAMNLMRTLAGIGKRVLLIDADLRASGIQAEYRPSSNEEFQWGLSEYLAGHCPLEEALYQTNISNACLIPAGHRVPNPLHLLESDNMKLLMEQMGEEFDVVLVDTPPAGLLSDAVALAKFCDGALIVVGYMKGKQREIGDVVKAVKQTGCRVLGAVLNDVKFKNLSNRGYYYNSERYSGYYYRSKYHKPTSHSARKKRDEQ